VTAYLFDVTGGREVVVAWVGDGPGWYDCARVAAARLSCGPGAMSWREVKPRFADVQCRWRGHDAGRVPGKVFEVRTYAEVAGSWTAWAAWPS
jgi:hypothetical protein